MKPQVSFVGSQQLNGDMQSLSFVQERPPDSGNAKPSVPAPKSGNSPLSLGGMEVSSAGASVSVASPVSGSVVLVSARGAVSAGAGG